jgi:hypothetical protein
MSYRPMRRGTALLTLTLGMAAQACSSSSPATPSPAATPVVHPDHAVALTVRVQARNTALPIARAQVLHDGISFYADTTGEATLSVPAGQETTIDVHADGYEPMTASAVLSNDERWTFYLAPQGHQP